MGKYTILIIIALSLTIVPLTVVSQESNVGYKEFVLGQDIDKVKGLIGKNYSGNKIKYLTNGDIELETGEMVNAYLYFNHKKALYMIKVDLKYSDVSKVKSKLVEKYGQPNDYTYEEEDRGNKMYLMGRWRIDKRYTIHLWESYYCRNQKFIPCVVSVVYLDAIEKDEKEKHERTLKEEEQKKKDSKTYDGF